MLVLVVGVSLSVLILLQILAKLVIWGRVLVLLRETKILNKETKLLLRIAQSHAHINDTQTARTESMVAQVKEVASKVSPANAQDLEAHVIEEVRQVPLRTAALLRATDSGASGIFPPAKEAGPP